MICVVLRKCQSIFTFSSMTLILLLFTFSPLRAQDEESVFPVWEYRVLGNSLLSEIDISEAVYPFLGPGANFETIDDARRALEQRYRDSGYPSVLVDIPQQTVGEDGIVRLRVTEATIDRVRVSGARYRSGRRIRSQFQSLEEGDVLYVPGLNEDLQSAARTNAGVSIDPVLRPGRRPGTTEIELRVRDEFPGEASLGLDNNYSRDTTELRATASLGYNDFWGRGDSLSLQFQTAPEDTEEVQVLAATYLLRPKNSEWIFAGYGVNSDSDVATVGDISVIGKGRIFGFRGIRTLFAGAGGFASLSVGADYKDFDDTITLDPETGLDTAISYCALSAGINAGYVGARQSLSGGVTANIGLRNLCNSRNEFEDKRFKGKPNYFFLRGQIDYERELIGDFLLSVRTGFQLTPDPLITNEQFALGGHNSVRGYLQSELLSDIGLTSSLQIVTPDVFGFTGGASGRGFVFVDWGGGRIRDVLPDQEAEFELYSAGIGMNIDLWERLRGSFSWSVPLEDGPVTLRDDDRWIFDFGYSF